MKPSGPEMKQDRCPEVALGSEFLPGSRAG